MQSVQMHGAAVLVTKCEIGRRRRVLEDRTDEVRVLRGATGSERKRRGERAGDESNVPHDAHRSRALPGRRFE